MNRYKVTIGPLRLHAGVLVQLDEKQAAARAHAVEPLGENWFVASDIEFKTGEEFGLRAAPDELPGSIAERVEPAAPSLKPARPAKAKKGEADG